MNRSNKRKLGPVLKLKLLGVEVDEENGIVNLRVRIPVGTGHLGISFGRELLVDLPSFKKMIAKKGGPTKNTEIDFQAEMDALSDPPADTPKITIIRRAIWDGQQFINCFGEFGPKAEEQEGFKYDKTAKTFWKRTAKGDIESYVAGLREPMANSPTLLFAFLTGLVPSLMLRMGVPDRSFCVAFTGQSTTGKSLSTRVTLSVSSRASEKDLKSMNLSPGRAGQLGGYSGTALTYGDVKASRDDGRKLAKVLQTLVFGIVGGVTRDALDSTDRAPPEACAAVLSFEKPVVPFFEDNDLELEDGDRVRILDIQVKDRDGGGIFELAPASAKHLADAVENTLREHHGVVLPFWVRCIGASDVKIVRSLVQKARRDFDEMVGTLSPLEARYMDSVGWIYIAGRMAINLKKLRVVDRETLDSHFELLTSRLLKAFNADDLALQAQVAQVRKALAASANFPLVEKGEEADQEECANGFRRMESDGMNLFVRLDFVGNLVASRNLDRLLREFERFGMLTRGPKEWTRPVSQKGLKRERYLKFDRDKLERLH